MVIARPWLQSSSYPRGEVAPFHISLMVLNALGGRTSIVLQCPDETELIPLRFARMELSVPIRAKVFIVITTVSGAGMLMTFLLHWHSDSLLKFACYLLIAVWASTLKVSYPHRQHYCELPLRPPQRSGTLAGGDAGDWLCRGVATELLESKPPAASRCNWSSTSLAISPSPSALLTLPITCRRGFSRTASLCAAGDRLYLLCMHTRASRHRDRAGGKTLTPRDVVGNVLLDPSLHPGRHRFGGRYQLLQSLYRLAECAPDCARNVRDSQVL